MALVDMKRSKKDMKKDLPAVSSEPDPYPYGVMLNIDTDELKKLKVKDLPDVGDEYHIMAIGKVTRVSSSAGENDESQSISVQITKMELMPSNSKMKKPAHTVMHNSMRGK